MKITIEHRLLSSVIIKAVSLPGIVEEISLGINGISYRVGYWNNGERYSTWVNENEIMEGKEK